MKNFRKLLFFFDEKHFSKDFEKSKISKSHFFDFCWKTQHFQKSQLFRKKNQFFRFFEKVNFFEKSDFLKFSICQNLSKNSFRRKKINVYGFLYFLFFYRISCITSSSGIAELPLCRPWARLTSPPKIRKSRKFTFLKIFGGTFSL